MVKLNFSELASVACEQLAYAKLCMCNYLLEQLIMRIFTSVLYCTAVFVTMSGGFIMALNLRQVSVNFFFLFVCIRIS